MNHFFSFFDMSTFMNCSLLSLFDFFWHTILTRQKNCTFFSFLTWQKSVSKFCQFSSFFDVSTFFILWHVTFFHSLTWLDYKGALRSGTCSNKYFFRTFREIKKNGNFQMSMRWANKKIKNLWLMVEALLNIIISNFFQNQKNFDFKIFSYN